MTEKPTTADPDTAWRWDPTLYAGSAAYYAKGRAAYPGALADRLQQALRLDGHGRLLDVGCGPGSLTLVLAPLFAEAIGVDADADMLVEAELLAAQAQIGNVVWRHLRAESLPADLPPVDVVTFAQSFHWMDRPRVAAAARGLLTPAGTLVHVSATTHQGVSTDAALPHPQPPWTAIRTLVEHYLGERRRAGQTTLSSGTVGGEASIYSAVGFTEFQQIQVEGRLLQRTADEVAAAVYSLSSAAPHLFGDRLSTFDHDLHRLLHRAGPDGLFSEQMPPTILHLWR